MSSNQKSKKSRMMIEREIQLLSSRIKSTAKLRFYLSVVTSIVSAAVVFALIATSARRDNAVIYILCIGLVAINAGLTYFTFSMSIKAANSQLEMLQKSLDDGDFADTSAYDTYDSALGNSQSAFEYTNPYQDNKVPKQHDAPSDGSDDNASGTA